VLRSFLFIEACLRAQSGKLYRLGFRCPQISRNTMANANAELDWHSVKYEEKFRTIACDQSLPGACS
jgi:hypothetical protein